MERGLPYRISYERHVINLSDLRFWKAQWEPHFPSMVNLYRAHIMDG